MIKRILIVVAATAVAILCFTLWQKSQVENPHADEHEHEEHVDVENILLNEKQIKAVDLKWGNVETRELMPRYRSMEPWCFVLKTSEWLPH